MKQNTVAFCFRHWTTRVIRASLSANLPSRERFHPVNLLDLLIITLSGVLVTDTVLEFRRLQVPELGGGAIPCPGHPVYADLRAGTVRPGRIDR